MKKCCKCQEIKDDSSFCKHKTRKDGLNCFCRECNKYSSKLYYTKNKQKHIAACNKLKKTYYTTVKQKMQELKLKVGCQVENCLEKQPCCLDFHHIGNKDTDISRLVGTCCSWNRILSEVVKCSLVCSNCHRKIHAGILLPPIKTMKDVMSEKINVSRIRPKLKKPKTTEHNVRKMILSKDELAIALWEKPTTHIAKQLGISDKAVEKWAKKYGLEKPPRGYWAKQQALTKVSDF